MKLDALREGYRRILRHIYSPRHYYARIKTFLREYRPPSIRTRLTLQNLRAFARSIVRLGILGRERFHYWKLLAWTYFRRRELFPLAVSLAICGYHFRRIAEAQL